MTNFLLGVSGSVAAIKLPLLIQELQKRESNCNIKVIATKKALGFIDQQQISVEILTDDDEWKIDYKLGDPILHIQVLNQIDYSCGIGPMFL